jgi:CRISPR-associated protein Cas1
MKRSIYIFSDVELKRRQNTLFIELSDGKKKYIPVENTGEIHIFGEVTVNKKLLDFLTQNEIILHFYNYYGFYIGTYYPREYYNSGMMIVKQAEHYLDADKRLALARKFVRGALQNMGKVLQYYNSRGVSLEEEIARLNGFNSSLDALNSVDELMAIEGNSKDIYYRSFNKILKDEEFHFYGRERRPPRNKINALISFGNSLLYTYCLSEIYKTHLDPRIGFLHTSNFRRFSLNLDVAEVFKPIVVDRLIFSLINKEMLGDSHFMRELGGLYLNDRGRKIFVEEMENKLKSTIRHRKLKRNVSYRSLIRMELYKIEKHLLGEEEYKPFVALW